MSTRPDEPAEVPVTTGRPVALVTGVSRKSAIGAAICRALSRDGWDVVRTGYRPDDVSMPWGSRAEDPEELVEELVVGGGRAVWVEADLTAPTASRDLFDRAEAFGPVRPILAAPSLRVGDDPRPQP